MTRIRVKQPPDLAELWRLLDAHFPQSVLQALGQDAGNSNPVKSSLSELTLLRAEALVELDRSAEALNLLDQLGDEGHETNQVRGRLLKAFIFGRRGWPDASILQANRIAAQARDEDSRAEALAICAAGFAAKRCWGLSDRNLRDALEAAPTNPRVLALQARIRLEADQRLEARKVYERLATLASPWAQPVAVWGLSYVAYLLGEFEDARKHALAVLRSSPEYVPPLFTLAQIALAQNDLQAINQVVHDLAARSPQAENLTWLKQEAEQLTNHLATQSGGSRYRLAAFPTLVQRRDYCGPSTVELVLRYWNGESSYSNEQIAEKIKYTSGGTPIFRMREFFRLAGFDTIRCHASVSLLKQLIRNGFPVIIQQQYSNTSHVAVVIGFDETQGVMELQDPMTHMVKLIDEIEFQRLRRTFLDAALIAFPHGKGFEKRLARLEIFEEASLVWVDQAVLELEQGRRYAASELAERALKRKPGLAFGWLLRLHESLETWRAASQAQNELGGSSHPSNEGDAERRRFYRLLRQARQALPDDMVLTYQFEGWGALLDGNYSRALTAFQRASQLDEQDAANHASLAECYFALRDAAAAETEANRSLQIDPSFQEANIWMARCLAAHQPETALHFAACALDFGPQNWLAHYAMAEAAFYAGKLNLARQENDLALSLGSAWPEPHMMEAFILISQGEITAAGGNLRNLLAAFPQRSPTVEYKILQNLASLSFNSGQFDLALDQAQHMRDLYPTDPWTIQFQAAAYCEKLAAAEQTISPDTLQEVQTMYDHALEANSEDMQVLQDYLGYVEKLAGPTACLTILNNLTASMKASSRVEYLRGHFLHAAGDFNAAAQAMLIALAVRPGGQDRQETTEALQIILHALGPHEGIPHILAAFQSQKETHQTELWRSLGLVLAGMDPPEEEMARHWLRLAYEAAPDDAELALALGHVASSEEDRELLYRRGLMSAPEWPQARANLANYLTKIGRPLEALEFTRGYEETNFELLVAHGRALHQAGHYEEAAVIFRRSVVEVDEPESGLFFLLWQAETRCGDWERALRTARKASRVFAEMGEWYLYTAESLRCLERYDEADAMLRRAHSHGLSKERILQAEYETALARRDFDSALHIVDEYIFQSGEMAGDGRLGWAEKARMRLLVELHNFDEAMAFLHGENLSALGWGEAAWTAWQAGQPELALAFADCALELDPQNYPGLSARAQALISLGQEEDALPALYALRDAHPDDHDAYEKLAVRLAMAGHLEQALMFADQGVMLGSFCPFAWGARGLVYFLNGQVEEALHDLQLAYNRADGQNRLKNAEYWYLLALLQGKEGEAEMIRSQQAEQPGTALQNQLFERIRAAYS